MKRISFIIGIIVVLSALFGAYAYPGEEEIKVKERIGKTDVEVEFSPKLHIYRGDNTTFEIAFRNYNDKLRYLVNVDLKSEESEKEDITISMMKMIRGVTVDPEDDYPLVYWINPQKTGTYELTLTMKADYFGSMGFIEDLIYALPMLASMIPVLVYALPAIVPIGADYVLYIPRMLRGLVFDLLGTLEELKPLFDDVTPSVYKHMDFLLYLIFGGLKATIPQLPGDILHWIDITPDVLMDTVSRIMTALPHVPVWWAEAVYGVLVDLPKTLPRAIKVLPVMLSTGLSYRYYLPEDIAYATEALFPSTLLRLVFGPVFGAVMGAVFALIAWLLIMVPTLIPTLSLSFWIGTPLIILGALVGAISGMFPSVGKSLALRGRGVSPDKGSGDAVYTITVEVTEKPFWVRLRETFDMWAEAITSFFTLM